MLPGHCSNHRTVAVRSTLGSVIAAEEAATTSNFHRLDYSANFAGLAADTTAAVGTTVAIAIVVVGIAAAVDTVIVAVRGAEPGQTSEVVLAEHTLPDSRVPSSYQPGRMMSSHRLGQDPSRLDFCLFHLP